MTVKNAHSKKVSRRVMVAGLAVGGLVAVGGIVWKFLPSSRAQYIYQGDAPSFRAVWSPDGKRIAASFQARVLAWDALNGDHLISYDHLAQNLFALSWSPDGKYCASANDDGSAEIWDATTWNHVSTIHGQISQISALAWSPDSTRLAIGGLNKVVQVVQWDETTGAKTLFTYDRHVDQISALSWSPDGTRLASSSWDTTVRILDAAHGTVLYTYTGHSGYPVNTVAWSPHGDTLVSASGPQEDNAHPGNFGVHVWSALDGHLLSLYTGHTDHVNHVAWSPDATVIASASDDSTVQLWNVRDVKTVDTYHGHTHAVRSVAWSPDGAYLASAGDDMTVQVWKKE